MFQSKITTVILGCAFLWLLLVAVGAGLRHASLAHDLAVLEDRISGGQRDMTRISQELVRMSQPGWLALLARERLNYQRPGETVVFVYTAGKPGTIEAAAVTDTRPNWKKWMDWLTGK